jgi:hypothetical protein
MNKTRRRVAQCASATPHAPAATARATLSTSSWRINLLGRAPKANRMANSGCRAAARVSRRFAALAHAINNTTPTSARRMESGRENWRRSSESAVAGFRTIFGGAACTPGGCGSRRNRDVSTSWAWIVFETGFKRAIACTQVRFTMGFSRRFSYAGITVGCIIIGRKRSAAAPISTPKNSGGVTR